MHDDCEIRTRPALQKDTPPIAKHPPRTQANVCVIADHGLGATYLSELLQRDASIHLVTLADLVAPPEPTGPGTVFIMDYGLRLPFSQCLLALRQNFPTGRYLAVDRERSQEDVMRIMQLGVDGFIFYRDVPAMLIRAVHEVAAGQLWVEAQILKALLKSRSGNAQVNHAVTYRETQVLELAKGRLTNKEIGSVLGIQESTVKYHLTNIFSKLGINSREELLENPDPTGCWASLLRSSKHKVSKESLYRTCKAGT
jgi:DNA-binding NarL/FixJ family response regulator